MWRVLERLRTPLFLAFAILFPAGLYRAHSRDPGRVNAIDRVLLAASAPIQRFLINSVGAVSDTWTTYVDVVDARRRQSVLRRELDREVGRRRALEALEVENEHLRALLDLEKANPAHEMVAARIIGASLDPGLVVVRVDRGALDGLARGFPIVTERGLVGRVLHVAWTTSEVQLISDPKVSVPVKALRTGARGRLEGNGSGVRFDLLLTEVLRSDDLRPGDRIVTSGLGGTFPANVPVGVVTRIFTRDGVPHRFADVVPFVDFARLEVVQVVRRPEKGRPLVTPDPLLPPALRELRPDGGLMDLGPWPPEATVSPDAGVSDLGVGDVL